jgi:geranylgeranyl reductase family protein
MERVLTDERHDILIAGAGPAGLATALSLASKGIPSTLIDRETFPRDKVCGDGLSGWVVRMLDRIEPSLVEKVRSHPGSLPSYGIRFYAPNLKSVDLPYRNRFAPDDPPGYVMRRQDFDGLLMETALSNPLIRVMQGVNLAGLSHEDGRVVLTDIAGNIRLKGKMAVVATGAGSKLAGNVTSLRSADHHQATGIRQYFTGVESSGEGNFVELFFLYEFLPGYLWVFPLPDGRANVGAGIRTDFLRKRKLSLKRVMEQALMHNPILSARFRHAQPASGVAAWTLPLGSRKHPLSGEGILLAGDAASLVDPFTGEGIGNALWSGYTAAGHIEKAMAANRFDASFNKAYDRQVQLKFGKEMRTSHTIQRLVRFPSLFNFVMNRTVANPELVASVIRMIDDPAERKKLTRPFFYLRLLKR